MSARACSGIASGVAGDLHAPRLQNGLGFASAAICGALNLTTVASSAPLASAWSGFGGNFHDFATWISAYLPSGSRTRFPSGADFGTSTVIGSTFNESSSLVFTIQAPEGAPVSHWRVISYDTFESTGWAAGAGSQSAVLAGDGLNEGTLDQVAADTSGRTTVTYTVNVSDSSLQHLVVANEPVSATISVTRVLVGGSPSASDVVWFPTNATNYSVTASVPNLSFSGTGLTESLLRQAGTNYPPGLLDRYTQGADLVGSAGQDLLRQIESWAKSNGVAVDPKTGHFTNSFDAANAIQAYLRDPNNFTYDSNISDLACESLTTVDCFATFKRGFCEQYATTMTMLMRMDGYPARYVEGYLSGHVEQASRAIDVTGQQRHAWVEVYFPTYGWIPFDPTGGSVGQPTELPLGSPAKATPSPLPSQNAGGTEAKSGQVTVPRAARPRPHRRTPAELACCCRP